MASKQTRRSISVRGTTYSLLRDFCSEHDRSMSDVVEELLSRILEGSAAEAGPAARSKTVAPLLARAPQRTEKLAKSEKPAVSRAEPVPVAKVAARIPDERGAVRVDPRPAPAAAPTPAPAPRAATPARPGPARPVPIANAGRPAPTPATKVEGTQRGKPGSGDYRAIRF